MDVNLFFLMIGLTALGFAVQLKLQEIRKQRRIKEAIERAQIRKAREQVEKERREIRGKRLADEREWR